MNIVVANLLLFRDNVTKEQWNTTLTRIELKKVLVVKKMLDELIITEERAVLLGLSTWQALGLKKT
ncbi:hypothetical protein ACFSTH_00170 [Paenibacillus yanchengensis]|uniref:Uncharacterized protein n=1 Tax=Paenibacillus yanchengensis TaxID=2035833 RepID=A0ABW4YEZ4_9BACL